MTGQAPGLGHDTASPAPDRSIPFVETHHHLWQLDRFPYRWLNGDGHDELMGDIRPIRHDMLPARLYRDFHGQHVTACVHVEADSGAPDPVDETAWLASLARTHGHPDALIVMCDLESPDVERQLERHLEASPLVRGVRIREHPAIASAAFTRGYAAIGRHGLSYELSASPGRLADARPFLARYPNVRVMVGHAGFPVRRDMAYLRTWRRELAGLAELDHVACKVSGFATIDHDWTMETLRPLVMTCIEAFGIDRVVFGTDWPVSGLFAPYTEQVDAYRVILATEGFSRDQQAAMLHANAERCYDLRPADQEDAAGPR